MVTTKNPRVLDSYNNTAAANNPEITPKMPSNGTAELDSTGGDTNSAPAQSKDGSGAARRRTQEDGAARRSGRRHLLT
eukprot:CAMPEP_0194532024 /NCGR_PEP_ID=MMETSP0253-20130528/69465_1 /TAXON_ID=2966 /ORGANISM="Noctiluca scintillans" /LENGTH=77 /DNA_ID=CAMNT_0039377423 /DNA_START=821 /DNA_END=1051 /DNA_ORIENTATION=+